jgi:hypothetical protein
MPERFVVWTETAARQRRDVLEFWTKHNGSTNFAEKLITAIAKRIQLILKHQESFKSNNYLELKGIIQGYLKKMKSI